MHRPLFHFAVVLALSILALNAGAQDGGRNIGSRVPRAALLATQAKEVPVFKSKKVEIVAVNESTVCGRSLDTSELLCSPTLPSVAVSVGSLKKIFTLNSGICGYDEDGFKCWARDRYFNVGDMNYVQGGAPEDYLRGDDLICRKQLSADGAKTIVTCLTNYMDINGTGTLPVDPSAPRSPAKFQYTFGKTLDVSVTRSRICALQLDAADNTELVCLQGAGNGAIIVPSSTVQGATRVFTSQSYVCLLYPDNLTCFDAAGPMMPTKPIPSQQEMAGLKSFSHNTMGFCMVLASGRVHCDTLGRGNNAATIVPTDLEQASPAVPAVKVEMGYYFSCALLANGTVRCWGESTNENLKVPTFAAPVTDISMAESSSCAMMGPDAYTCWGSVRNQGQALKRGTPVNVSMGIYQSVCAWNGSGLLCDLDTGSSNNMPKPAQLQNAVVESVSINKVDSGSACGIKRDLTTGQRSIFCWGSEASILNPPQNLPNVLAIELGDRRACAVDADYGINCWGSRNFLSDVPTVVVDHKRLIMGNTYFLLLDRFGLNCYGECAQTASLLPPVMSADLFLPGRLKNFWMGENYICGLLQDGSVRCWGDNQNSQLMGPPLLQNPISMTGTKYYTCASDDRGVQCWGNVPEDIFK